MPRHISKKPDAERYLNTAINALILALEDLRVAEKHIKLSGWHRAGTGIHQAALRIQSWREKAEKEFANAGHS